MQQLITVFIVTKEEFKWKTLQPASGGLEAIHKKEVLSMNTPKIVFKSDIPEDALNSLAAVFIEQIEKLLETEEGKAEFEKFMKEHSDENKA